MRSTWETVEQGCEAEPGGSDSWPGQVCSAAAGPGDRTWRTTGLELGVCRVRFLHNEVTFPLLHLVSISGVKT